jgi:DNA mismatch endonuclease (patch repair protein)
MIDIVSKETRSRMMAGIRGKNTSPEMKVRKHLHTSGFRYRLHLRSLLGIPDIVLPKYNLVIFVHGCFWHRHQGCRFTTMPSDPDGKWQRKFHGTLIRDSLVLDELTRKGWRIFILWECGLTKGPSLSTLDWLDDAVRDLSIKSLDWPAPSVA